MPSGVPFGGELPRQIAVPRPIPREAGFIIVSTRLRRGKPSAKPSQHGSPPWRFFCPCKRNQNRVKGDRFPLDKPLSVALLRWIRKAFFLRKKPSVLHADGLNKVSQMHLPPPNLPRFGGGDRPPFSCKPPAPLTITMGRRPVDTIACKSESVYFPAP